MWNEVIRIVNLDGMYRCIKCGTDLEYGIEGVDFEFSNGYSNKVCISCGGTKFKELEEVTNIYYKLYWFLGTGIRAKAELDTQNLWDKIRTFIWLKLPKPNNK